MKLQKPDCTFGVRVCPVFTLISCDKKRDEERRGLFGFHAFDSCPNCVKVENGWEGWGSNGHSQFHVHSRESLLHILKMLAGRQWRMQDGRTMGYKFTRGHRITYAGN